MALHHSEPDGIRPDALPGADLPVHHLRHPGRWVAGAAVVLILAVLIQAFAAGNIRWPIVGQFLTAPVIVKEIGRAHV